jgi:carboxyl-terminal processing protease
MRKNWRYFIGSVLFSTLALAADSLPAQYLDVALTTIIDNAAYSNRVEWSALRKEFSIELERAKSVQDVYPLIRRAVTGLGDRHSKFYTAQEAQLLATGRTQGEFGLRATAPEHVIATVIEGSPASAAGLRPGDTILTVNGGVPQGESGRLQFSGTTLRLSVRRDADSVPRNIVLTAAQVSLNVAPHAVRISNLGYLELPLHLGQGEIAGRGSYAQLAHDAMRRIGDGSVCGWIVDLRRNQGGNFWPMLAAVGPLLGEGPSGGFYANGKLTQWEYRAGSAMIRGEVAAAVRQPYTLPRSLPPVAVLTSRFTASSGEAIAVSFRGRALTRSFGEGTRGVPTANGPFPLSDGALLNLTVGFDADRTGRVYESSLDVDVSTTADWRSVDSDTDPVVIAASNWLRTQSACKP